MKLANDKTLQDGSSHVIMIKSCDSGETGDINKSEIFPLHK